MNSVTIFPELEGISSKDDDLTRIRTAATDAINKWGSDLTIFTDGSAVEGCKQGIAAAGVQISWYQHLSRSQIQWPRGDHDRKVPKT